LATHEVKPEKMKFFIVDVSAQGFVDGGKALDSEPIEGRKDSLAIRGGQGG
jgi:hypothetical protein